MASKCASCVHEEVCRYKENMMKFEDHIKEQTNLMEFSNFSADVKCNNFKSKTTKEEGVTIPAFMRPVGG